MKRVDLVSQLLQTSMKAAMAQMDYREHQRRYAPDENLYYREVHLLVAVGPEGKVTMSEIARRLEVTQGAVTQTAARLEKKGYLVRAKDAVDRRLTTVSLTEKGRALCAQHIAYDKEKYQEVSNWLSEFSDDELALCFRFQKALLEMYTKNK